jgi:hypothetical protein
MTGPQKIVHLLNQAKVNFIVVGAYATIAMARSSGLRT